VKKGCSGIDMDKDVEKIPEDVTKFEPIVEIEPVTNKQLIALAKALGPISSMVVGLGFVDLSKGRGVLNKDSNDRCLWDKDGRRITIYVPSTGGIYASRSKSQDPYCPK
jgi:hypothetical protein